jgi:hypothetical protein
LSSLQKGICPFQNIQLRTAADVLVWVKVGTVPEQLQDLVDEIDDDHPTNNNVTRMDLLRFHFIIQLSIGGMSYVERAANKEVQGAILR